MAEVAAAAIAAEQVVATGIEAAAAVAIAAPTLPLKISLTHLPSPAAEPSHHQALARSNHTLTVLANHNKAIIFGGQDASGALCPPAIHTITLPSSKTTPTPNPNPDPSSPSSDDDETYSTAYTCYPPYPLQDANTNELLLPSPRSQHAACARSDTTLLIHGGQDGKGNPIGADENCLWQWDNTSLSWSKLRGDTQLGKAMAPRYGHWMFVDDGGQRFLVLVGGKGGGSRGEEMEREVWMYDFHGLVWTAMPSVPGKPLAAAYARGRVYVISDGGDEGELGGVVYYLDMKESADERAKPGALVWETVEFPANPLAPGPKPRASGALVPLATGYGRVYLVYMFGCGEGGEAGEKEYYSDVWTLQLPTHGRNPAAIKDKIREKLPGMESGEFRWAEAEIVPTEQMTHEGKVHPGPRGFFGADSCLDGRAVVMWGGMNPKGETEADGWILRLAHGYADNDRWE